MTAQSEGIAIVRERRTIWPSKAGAAGKASATAAVKAGTAAAAGTTANAAAKTAAANATKHHHHALTAADTATQATSSGVSITSARAGERLTTGRLIGMGALAAAGFAIAILVNVLVPLPAGTKLEAYVVGPLGLNREEAYRFFLGILIIAYTAALAGAALWRPDHGRHQASRAPFRFAMGIALALWDVTGDKLQVLPQPFFPGPARITEAFISDTAQIFGNALYSLRLFGTGFAIGIVFGIGTGILIGWYAKAYYWVFPILKTSGIIPAVAWMPFALTLFVKPFAAAVFLIVICEWFQVAFLTAEGIQNTPKRYYEAARTLGASDRTLLWRVAVPHAMPSIFLGITTANACAFATLVTAEMMGQPGGLGYYINASKIWAAYNNVFAAIVLMAVLFSLIVKVTNLVQNHVLRWQKGLVK